MKFVINLIILSLLWTLNLQSPAGAERRLALVIGNSAYTSGSPLANPKNDAELMAAKLEGLGFDVLSGVDLNFVDFRQILIDFSKALTNADTALLFYAGHGVQVQGKNYLLPVDAQLNQLSDLRLQAFPIENIQSLMESVPRTNLLFFDACRNSPFTRRLARSLGTRSGWVGRGLAELPSGVNTLVAFSTSPGNVASDGTGLNSPFTSALARHIDTTDLDVQLMLRKVRADVISATNRTQIPWDRSSLVTGFLFNAGGDRTTQPKLALTSSRSRYKIGETIKLQIKTPVDCRLTLLNVDNKGKSCLLYPHPALKDKILKAGTEINFPPKGSLRLEESGTETFIAMCNSSPKALAKERRDTKQINCSKGAADRTFNDKIFETVVFDLGDKDDTLFSARQAKRPKVEIIRSTLSVTVSP